MEIDDLDKRILDVLQRNSRLSSRKIAGLLDVSPSTVGDRIKALQKKGIIKRFTIQVDPDGLGLGCSLLIMVKIVPSEDSDKICEAISDIKEICYVYRVTGGFDFVLISKASNRDKALEILDKVSKTPGVTDVNSSWILQTVKEKTLPRDCLN